MTAVADSGPLIWLSQVDQFSLLQELFEVVIIPPAVHTETVVNAIGYPNAVCVQAATEAGWMRICSSKDRALIDQLRSRLDLGEAEALALSAELGSDVILMDDRRGRLCAEERGLRVIGTVGLLLLAQERGAEFDLRATLDWMRSQGFRLGESVYRHIVPPILS